jgi:hypothetical protein
MSIAYRENFRRTFSPGSKSQRACAQYNCAFTKINFAGSHLLSDFHATELLWSTCIEGAGFFVTLPNFERASSSIAKHAQLDHWFQIAGTVRHLFSLGGTQPVVSWLVHTLMLDIMSNF